MRFGTNPGLVREKSRTFKRPDEENKTLATAVAAKGTSTPEKANHRTADMGKTAMR